LLEGDITTLPRHMKFALAMLC